MCLVNCAVAALISIGFCALPAPAAMADSGAAPVRLVANICGANGCVRVQTQRIQHQKPGAVSAKHI
jgi:hypothetical protein